MAEVKLLTEAEARALTIMRADDAVTELRERGLIAPEPVDPLVYVARQLVIQDGTTRTVNQIEAIRDGHAGKDKVALALAALRRGMELAKPELTREQLSDAIVKVFGEGERGFAGVTPNNITALHAALTEGQSK